MLAGKPRGTLYLRVTNGSIRRVEQHRAGEASAFTRRYQAYRLVCYRQFASVREAIQREKTRMERLRARTVNLIKRENRHLYPSLPGVAHW
jgi:putative endonuclease